MGGPYLAYERDAVLVARREGERVHQHHRRAVVRGVHQHEVARLRAELQQDVLVHVLLERAALVQLAEPVVERHHQPEDVRVEVAREADTPGLELHRRRVVVHEVQRLPRRDPLGDGVGLALADVRVDVAQDHAVDRRVGHRKVPVATQRGTLQRG